MAESPRVSGISNRKKTAVPGNDPAALEEQLKACARRNPGEVASLINEWLSSSDAQV